MEPLAIFLLALLVLAALMTLGAFLRLPHGLARVCDFPRLQIAGTSGGVAVAAPAVVGWDFTGTSLMLAGAAITVTQIFHVLPYTRVWRRESPSCRVDHPANSVKILVSNVLQSNDQYDKLAEQIDTCDADIVILMEVNQAWLDALSDATASYRWKVEVPLENTYGLAVYSRLELIDPKVHYLLRETIPSMISNCRLRNGEIFKLIAIHPEPPLPHIWTYTRDAEIILAGQIARESEEPAIVTGDINDVAWSHTTRRFRRLSKLLDPRIGRGLFNTYHAGLPLARWPLDQLFHDPRFLLGGIERLPNVGSDHFPIAFTLVLAEVPAAAPEAEAKPSDVEEANELLEVTNTQHAYGPVAE
jgi:endonuclease/exonuclease/phosphatase (EEP) superfamily protein YafD